MKKISFFTLALASSMAVFAQSNPAIGSGSEQPKLRTAMEVKPRFGIKAGVNLANLEVDDDVNPSSVPNTNSKTSFNGGVFFNLPIAGMFRIQPELLWSGQGAKVGSGVGTLNKQMSEFDFGYIQVPVMAQIQTPGGFFVETGPQFGLLMRAQEEYVDGTTVNIEDMDMVKKTDLSWGAGLGYLSRVGLGISGRYNFGLSNVWNNDNRSAGPVYNKMKNGVVQVGLVYHFGANQ